MMMSLAKEKEVAEESNRREEAAPPENTSDDPLYPFGFTSPRAQTSQGHIFNR